MDPRQVAPIELEVEREIVRTHPDVRDLAGFARERGLRIALVSDTYFRAEQLRGLVDLEADFVLASCEHGLSKQQGLHRILIEESGVPPSRILHVGDNEEADVLGAETFGIASHWFPKNPEPFDAMIAAELPETTRERSDAVLGPDHGLHHVRSLAIHAHRDPYERWGAGILGPVVTGFGEWAARRCREIDARAALCLMREGRVLQAVLNRVDPSLAAAEVYLSRYVVRKAAMVHGSEEEIRDFIRRPSRLSRDRLLEQLGIRTDHPWKRRPDVLLDPDGIDALTRRICEDPKLRRQVVASSARCRAALLAHLRRACGGIERGTVAVVDLGYQGTIQGGIEKIFAAEGIPLRTHGLYLVTNDGVHRTQATGAPAEGWLAENGQPVALAHSFVRSPEVFEQSLMADCGTTLGHRPDGEPILDEFRIPAEQRDQITAIQRGLLTFAGLWGEIREIGPDQPCDRLRSYCRAVCVRAVARPSEHEIGLFGAWRHDENFGSESSRTLIEPVGLDLWEREHLSAHQIASLPSDCLHWPFGFARSIGIEIAEAVAAIYLRRVDPCAFQSRHGERPLVLYWDTGRGFNADEAEIVSYRPNEEGRTWIRLTIELREPAVGGLGVSIGVPGEILRLTGAKIRRADDPDPAHAIRLSHDRIAKRGYEPLHGDLYLVREDPSLLALRSDRLGRWTGRIDIDLFFGLFKGE
ncbi:MAG: HAD-IA family hydrolase [Candidatus Eisenbacteria bacterium]|nr:HAD-IA family hydrolase [Candidatus Latescibacterota bacterium]MBD3301266.1 HAD-IA family hydrolase [Candidatus Eisenbacteria bacterium]